MAAKRKCTKKWETAETFILIEKYQLHPTLWDVSSADYHKENLRQAANSEIAEALNTTGKYNVHTCSFNVYECACMYMYVIIY